MATFLAHIPTLFINGRPPLLIIAGEAGVSKRINEGSAPVSLDSDAGNEMEFSHHSLGHFHRRVSNRDTWKRIL